MKKQKLDLSKKLLLQKEVLISLNAEASQGVLGGAASVQEICVAPSRLRPCEPVSQLSSPRCGLCPVSFASPVQTDPCICIL
ncbi:class I lanthipeptide [Chitinophaga nivalis]|uniref:Class I lanthipeptide n=1 Tax=Chitinophaga nivalis TaxID=2991709 RepID=A0ABT3IPB2_9BACT|nr:class I lanthipeptide [Chitinophaga nivalis]MCW3464526.1 class I lanthipeptide [Chitinophaga nivalis]MCW3485783.1 class I lanthipeptide [Chitinophaga nivalis]